MPLGGGRGGFGLLFGAGAAEEGAAGCGEEGEACWVDDHVVGVVAGRGVVKVSLGILEMLRKESWHGNEHTGV